MKKLLTPILTLILTSTILTAAPLQITSTTPELADLVRQVGGTHTIVHHITPGNTDLHSITPRPSMVIKLKKSDLVFRIGMGLDTWIDTLIETSKNQAILKGNPSHIDLSKNIPKLQIPQGKIDGSHGDIHTEGNPHYWLAPSNALIMLDTIQAALIQKDPQHAKNYQKNANRAKAKLQNNITRWKQIPLHQTLITYHKTWPYFAKDFGLNIIDRIEPKPGIPPAPKHLNHLKRLIKTQKDTVILQANYYPTKAGKFLNIPVFTAPTSAQTYIELIETIIGKLKK